MPQSTVFSGGGELLLSVLSAVDKKAAEALAEKYDRREFMRVAEDKDLLSTCFKLFENDLNVSLTARKLFMHRNTLIYRLKKVCALTGLNVAKFGDAVAFIILYRIFTDGKLER